MLGECHSHIFMDGIDYKAARDRHKAGVDEQVIHQHFRAYKEAGITFVRDGGDRLGVSERARNLAGAYGIDYRTPIFAIYQKGAYGSIVGRSVENLKDYGKLLEILLEKRADFVKIMASGILNFDRFGEVLPGLPKPGMVGDMVAMAHAKGFAVMAHVNTAPLIKLCLKAGCDSIEHGYYMDEECRKLFREKGSVWVPTLATCGNLRGRGRFEKVALEKIIEDHQRKFALALEEGVVVAAGSDAGAWQVLHGEGLADEYRLMKEAWLRFGKGEIDLEARLLQGQRRIQEAFRWQKVGLSDGK